MEEGSRLILGSLIESRMMQGSLYVVNVVNGIFISYSRFYVFDFCHISDGVYGMVFVQYGDDTLAVQLSFRLFLDLHYVT